MIAAATGGMLSWVFYLAFSFLGSDLAQYLISTIVVSAYAEVMARVFKAPVTGFLTIGILPLAAGRRHLLHDGVLRFRADLPVYRDRHPHLCHRRSVGGGSFDRLFAGASVPENAAAAALSPLAQAAILICF